jgi:polyphosphate kinase 2
MAKDKGKNKKKEEGKRRKEESKKKRKLEMAQAEVPVSPGEEAGASSPESAPTAAEAPTEPRPKMSRREFEKELEKLQVELVKMQEWVKATGAKICVIFEGRDTAGKGGVIRCITERVSPRVFRVVALGTPTEREKSQMYFQRYMPHLPAAGEVVLFDRSWYNRAGVERVMGFATPEEVEYFLKYTPFVERAILASGTHLIKYWLDVDKEEQAKRFQERNEDYRKIWKLSPMDLEAQARWYDYSRARDAMFAATDTPENPWYVVPSSDQRRARLNCISHLLSLIPYEEVPREPIKFPKRQAKGNYVEPDYPYHYVPEKY